jgi:hypothetical protein
VVRIIKKPFHDTISNVTELSEGRLNLELSPQMLERKDELYLVLK